MKITDNFDIPSLAVPYPSITKKMRIHGTIYPVGQRCTIVALLRTTMELLGSTSPDALGKWKMDVEECSEESILVVCLDEEKEFNTDVFDRCSQEIEVITYPEELEFEVTLLDKKFISEFSGNCIKFNYEITNESVFNVDHSTVLNSIVTHYDSDDTEVQIGGINLLSEYGLLFQNDRSNTKLIYGTKEEIPKDIFGDGSCDVFFRLDNGKLSVGEQSELVDLADIAYHSSYTQKVVSVGNNLNGKILNIIDFNSYAYNEYASRFTTSFITSEFTFSFLVNIGRNSALSDLGKSATVYTYFFGIFPYNYNPNTNSIASYKFGLRGSDGALVIWINTGVAYTPVAFPSITFVKDTTYHITISISDSNILKVYKNGVLLVNYTLTYPLGTKPTNKGLPYIFAIGVFDYPSSGWYANLAFSNIRVFKKVVSDIEATTIYNTDFVNLNTSELELNGNLYALQTPANCIIPVCGNKEDFAYSIDFKQNDCILYSGAENSVLEIGGNTISEDGIILNGASILHTAIPSTGTNTNSSIPNHDVDIFIKFRTKNTTFSGIQNIYKSGNNVNGIAIFLNGRILSITGRSNSSQTTISLSQYNLQPQTDYIIVYTSSYFRLYTNSLALLASYDGQVICGGVSTDQESIGNSAGVSPISGLLNNPEYFKGIVKEVLVYEKGTLVYSSTKSKKIYAEMMDTGELLPVSVANIDTVNNQTELVVHIPEIDSSKDLEFRIYANPLADDNTLVTDETVTIPTGISDDWDTLVGMAENDSACSYTIRKYYGESLPNKINIPYISNNFIPFMYALSGDRNDTVTRISRFNESGIVRLHATVGDFMHSNDNGFYCEFVLGPNVTSYSFGFVDCNTDNKANILIDYKIVRDENGNAFISATNIGPNSEISVAEGTVLRFAIDVQKHLVFLGVGDHWYADVNPYIKSHLCPIQAYNNPEVSIHALIPAVDIRGNGATGRFIIKKSEFLKYNNAYGFKSLESTFIANEFNVRHSSFYLQTYRNNVKNKFRDFSPSGVSCSNTPSIPVEVVTDDYGVQRNFLRMINASGEFITFSPMDLQFPGDQDYTLDFYFRRDSHLPKEYILGSMDSNGNGFYLSFEYNILTITYMDSPQPDANRCVIQNSGPTLDFSVHHLALCIESNVIYIFIDGVMTLSRALETGLYGVCENFCIGNAGSASDYSFNGLIHIVRIFKGYARWNNSFDLQSVKHDTFPMIPDFYGYIPFGTDTGKAIVGNVSNGEVTVLNNLPILEHGSYYIESSEYTSRGIGICNSLFNFDVGSDSIAKLYTNVNSFCFLGGSNGIYYNSVPYGGAATFTATKNIYGIFINTETRQVFVHCDGVWVGGKNPEYTSTGVLTLPESFFQFPLYVVHTGGNSALTPILTTAITIAKQDMDVLVPPKDCSSIDGSIDYYLSTITAPFTNTNSDETLAKNNGAANIYWTSEESYQCFRAVQNRLWRNAVTSNSRSRTQQTSNIRINYDSVTARICNRMELINGYYIYTPTWEITNTNEGIKNFSIYGSNSVNAFDTVDFNNTTDLTLIGTFVALEYSPSSNIQVIKLNNSTAYRYYIFKILDNYGSTEATCIRYIGLFEEKDENLSSNTFEVSISPQLIYTDYENLPVRINFNEKSGISSFDSRGVFGSIGDDYNKLYMYQDGVSLPIEVVKWDNFNNEAILWTKVPRVYGSNVKAHPKTSAILDIDSDGIIYDRAGHSYLILNAANTKVIAETDYDVEVGGYHGIKFTSNLSSIVVRDASGSFGITGDEDFCMHTWVHYRTNTNENYIYGISLISVGYGALQSVIGLKSTQGVLTLYYIDTSGIVEVPIGSMIYDRTTHLAIFRKNTTIYVAVDGVIVHSFVLNNDLNTQGLPLYFRIGCTVSNFPVADRSTFILPTFVKGESVWTSDFLPPNRPMLESSEYSSILVSFDPNAQDNQKIGLTGTAQAAEVWSDFSVVSHMNSINSGSVGVSTLGESGTIFGDVSIVEDSGNTAIQKAPTVGSRIQFTTPIEDRDNDSSIILIYRSYNSSGEGYILDNDESIHSFPYNNYYNLSSERIISLACDLGYLKFDYSVHNMDITSFMATADDHTYNSYMHSNGNISYGHHYQDVTKTYMLAHTNSSNVLSANVVVGTVNVSSFAMIVFGFFIHKKKLPDWMCAYLQNTYFDNTCILRISNDTKYIVNDVRNGFENAAIVDVSMSTSWMTEELTNFPFKLLLDNNSGISSKNFSGFFDCLSTDSGSKGSIVREYILSNKEYLFSNLHLNNIQFKSSPDSQIPVGIEFNGNATYLESSSVKIANSIHFTEEVTVMVRIKIGYDISSLNTNFCLVQKGKILSYFVAEFALWMFTTGYNSSYYGLKFTHRSPTSYGDSTTVYTIDSDVCGLREGNTYSIVFLRKKGGYNGNRYALSVMIDSAENVVFYTESPIVGILSSVDSPIEIGNGYSASPPVKEFKGTIEAVSIANRALDDWEINNFMKSGDIIHTTTPLYSTIIVKQDYSIPQLVGSTLTSIDVVMEQGIDIVYTSITFDGRSYQIFKNGAWIIIVSDKASIHGGVDGDWYYRNALGNFTLCTIQEMENSITEAVKVQNNQMVVDVLDSCDFSISQFDASTGICDVAFTFLINEKKKHIKNSYISSVSFNNKRIRVFDPINLNDCNLSITSSRIDIECVLSNLVDISDKLKVYCKLSNSNTWVPYTGGNIPVLVAGMNTLGLFLHIKAEVSNDFPELQSEDFIVNVKIL